ncbi:hypothetical protein ACFV23_28785 [Streptomyces sp. NPDC059627]
MNDTTKAGLAAAVAAGHVLGRTKKARLAFAMATYLAGRRFGLDPQQLLTTGLRKIGDAPGVAELNEQVRGELLGTGRQALAAAADRRLTDLAGSLHERTLRIGQERDEDEEYEDEHEEEEEGEEPEEETEEEPPQRRRRRTVTAARKRRDAPAPRKAAARKAATAMKTAKKSPPRAEKATAKRSAARRR